MTGTGTVALNSGNDTSLKGAVVTGGTMIANVGGDLAIESRQDASRYREKSTSVSGGISSSGVTVGANRSTVKGDFANVAEQSGIVAGAGGYHVAVGGGVDLKAGVIASSAEKDKNALSADHLTYSNLDNVSNASSSGFGLSVGIGADGKPSIPTPSVSQPANEEDSRRALATLTPGALTLDHQTQDLSGLNTDLGKANTTVSPYDIDRLKAKQESAAALSELLNGLTGDISNQLGFKEGSPEKIALHTAVGAIVAKVAGGDIAAGAAAGAASEIANGVLQEVLKANPNLSNADSKAITQWVAVVVGAAAGGEAGAATAIDNVNHNYLTHEELEKAQEANRRLRDCIEGKQCSPEEWTQAATDVNKYKAISQANTRELISICSEDGASAKCRAKVDDLIRFANEAKDLFYEPDNDHASPYMFAAGTFNLDNYLAYYLKRAIGQNTDPKEALEAGLNAYARKEGTVKAMLGGTDHPASLSLVGDMLLLGPRTARPVASSPFHVAVKLGNADGGYGASSEEGDHVAIEHASVGCDLGEL